MPVIATLAKRELASLFYSPVGYLVLFVFLAYMSLIFVVEVFIPGKLPDMSMMFANAYIVLIFAVPLFTMSLLSDEYRSGRIETLRTSPVTERQIVLGKFLGALGFFLAMAATTLVYVLFLMIYGRPDYGAVLTSYIGLLLLGAMFIAVGLFFSACTQHQIIAAVSTIGVLAIVGLFGEYMPVIFKPQLPPTWKAASSALDVLGYLAFRPHMVDFSRGLIGWNHVVYFASGVTLFLFLTYLLLESRKWR